MRGVLDASTYDAAVPDGWSTRRQFPGARVALVVASGGGSLWEAFSRSPEHALVTDPLDAYTRRVVTAAAGTLDGAGGASRVLLAFERHGGVFADFVELGRLAGLGARSRLGLLIHPHYGPWLSLRAVVLVRPSSPSTEWVGSVWGGESSTGPLSGFDPCRGCRAPCETACPGGAVSPGGFSVGRCAATRVREPGCAEDCAARRACVLGPGHAYPADALAHHMRHARVT